MRENLIYTGLAEHAGRGTENCENKVREFISTELGIRQDMSFDRVHRLGRFSLSQRFDKPIVAKFTFFACRPQAASIWYGIGIPSTLDPVLCHGSHC